MLKKMMVLIGALLAVAAVSAPAASAEWLDEGVPFEGHETVELEGHAFFLVPGLGGVTCEEAYFSITVEDQNAEVVAFDVTNPTSKCKGLIFLAACEPEHPTMSEANWPVSAGTESLSISGINFLSNYNNCSSTSVSKGHVTANVTAESGTGAIEAVSLEGTATTGIGTAQIGGELEVISEPTLGVG